VAPVAAAQAPAAGPPRPYFVLLHAPGRTWDAGKSFADQDGIERHVAYMKTFRDNGQLLLGGPFLDNSGGMMIFDVPTLDEARAIALADPTVAAGLLVVTVKPWLAALRRAA
jgi:uncharacterized protein YciI